MECAQGVLDPTLIANKKDVAPPPQVEAKQIQSVVAEKPNLVSEAKASIGKNYKP
jgi:hypothetical protein